MLAASWLFFFISRSHTCVFVCFDDDCSIAAWMKSKFYKLYFMQWVWVKKTVSHFMYAVMFRFHSPTFYAPFSFPLHYYSRIFIVWWFSGFLSLPFVYKHTHNVRCYYYWEKVIFMFILRIILRLIFALKIYHLTYLSFHITRYYARNGYFFKYYFLKWPSLEALKQHNLKL